MSDAPVRTLSFVAVVLLMIGTMLGGWLAVASMNTSQAGWSIAITLSIFLAGMQFGGMALLGTYVVRILNETRKRPGYIIREVRSQTNPQEISD